MGEYAIRKYDDIEIKMGTCENMYYIRYEDRNKVYAIEGNINPADTLNLRWRLPFPDEDNIIPGEYKEYNRAVRLCDKTGGDFKFNDSIKFPGIIQLKHPSGLLVNVNCYHGEKLPKDTNDTKYHWNGKSWSWELVFIKNTEHGIKPIIHCRHCNKSWQCEWVDIIAYIPRELEKRFMNLGYLI